MLTMVRVVVLGVCVLLLGVGAPSAQAETDCKLSGTFWVCKQVGEVPGNPGGGGDGGSQPVKQNDPGKATVCKEGGVEVACTSVYGMWSSADQCYLKVSDPQPEKSDPLWLGRSEGAIYNCTSPLGEGLSASASGYQLWLASGPTMPPPNPEVLAQRAIATIGFRGIVMGTGPETLEFNPDSLGAVGLPVWLWAEETTPNTTGPVTASASERGFTVSVRATMTDIVWDIGDGGQPVTCGIGVRFDPRMMNPDTPVACGRQQGYQKQGEYTITATSMWRVEWNGIGESGVIPIEATSSGTVRIGEIQVVVKNR